MAALLVRANGFVYSGHFVLFYLCFDCFWLFLTIGTVYHSQKQSKTVKRQSNSKKWPLVYQSSQVYQDCTNSVPAVYQSSKTVKTQSKQHKMSRIHKAVCAYQQCCHLVNGNKTCPSLLVFKNNNMARGSHGFVCQSWRNVPHVWDHLCLTSFF